VANQSRDNIASTTPARIVFPPCARHPFIPAWFRDLVVRNLSGSEWKVLSVYIARANIHGVAYPSVGGLCADTKLGINAVKRARTRLVAMGLLVEIAQERHGGKFGQKTFRLGWK